MSKTFHHKRLLSSRSGVKIFCASGCRSSLKNSVANKLLDRQKYWCFSFDFKNLLYKPFAS